MDYRDYELGVQPYVLFSERMMIQEIFYAWCDEHHFSKEPCNLVAFMQSKGWLNAENIKTDMKSIRNNPKNPDS